MENYCLTYITGNKHKFETAQRFLKLQGIEITQEELGIDEIQSDSIEEVAQDKAKKAYDLLKKPLFVSDSGWYVAALKGFPGPYMKYMNQWFSPEDFVNLWSKYQDREVVLRQALIYIDEDQIKTFIYDSPGIILNEIRGQTGIPSDRVISLSHTGLSIAEEKEGKGFSITGEEKLWEEFVNWLKANQ